MHVAIVAWTAENRVSKYAEFDDAAAAAEHVAAHGGFVAANPPGHPRSWLIDPAAQTISDAPPEPTHDEITAERDRRIDRGFTFGEQHYQSDAKSRDNIANAAMLALGAMIADPAGDDGLRWADPERDFTWTTADNREIPMTAQECVAFYQAAIAYKTRIHKSARDLKEMQPIPGDYDDDRHWPDSILD